MKLIPFTEDHYDTLISWIPDAEFNLLWGGPAYTWPLDAEQIAAHVKQKGVYPFIFTDGDKAIGFIELVKQGKKNYRICRVLIADDKHRGKGDGSRLMRLVMDKATAELGAHEFELAVFEHNTSAIRCYQNLGFSTYSIEPISQDEQGNKGWVSQKMKLKI